VKRFRVGSEVMVKEWDGRADEAEMHGIVTETHSKTSWSPRGYMVQVGKDEPSWYPEKYVFPRARQAKETEKPQ
jgi:hypothetical protein